MQRITTFLTFESRGKEAVEFYISIFKNAHLNSALSDGGKLLHAAFTLDGQDFMAMDAGPPFKFEQGISLFVTCHTQEEVDYYWEELGEGGQYLQCGWLKDKFGVSWQVIPTALGELMSGPDSAQTQRVAKAMMGMVKIDIDGLKRAAEQK